MQNQPVYFLLYNVGVNTTPANIKSIRLTAPVENGANDVTLTDIAGGTYVMKAGDTVLISAEINCYIGQFTVTPAAGATCKVIYT